MSVLSAPTNGLPNAINQAIPIAPAHSSSTYGIGRGFTSTENNVPTRGNILNNLYGSDDAKEGLGRGELTGDHCLTIDLFGHPTVSNFRSVIATTWAERRNRCVISIPTSASISTHLSISMEGRSLLRELPHQLSNSYTSEVLNIALLISSKIIIGGVIGKSNVSDESLHMDCILDFILADSGQAILNRQELETALALLILRCIIEVSKEKEKELEKERNDEISKTGKGKSKKGKSKGGKVGCSLNLVVPCGLSQQQGFLLYAAAGKAVQYHSTLVSSGLHSSSFQYSVHSLSNRGVATVAGAISMTSLRTAILSRNKVGEKENSPADDKEPLVFYMRWLRDQTATPAFPYFEAALIRCEGGASATISGNLLGFDRLATLAAITGISGTSWRPEDVSQQLSTALDILTKRASLSGNEQVTALIDADSVLYLSESNRNIMASPSLADRLIAVEWLSPKEVTAAAVGGCLLCAAELDSSKQYLLQKSETGDKWRIAYQLPVADGCLLSGDVGLRVDFVDSTEAELSALAVRPAFESGSRLWKTDIGPLKPNRIRSGPEPVKLEFRWRTIWSLVVGNLWRMVSYMRGSGAGVTESELWIQSKKHKQALAWPKVRIFERVRPPICLSQIQDFDADTESVHWNLIKTLTPLATTKNSKTKSRAEEKDEDLELVESCDMLISADPNTGLVKIVDSKGPTLTELQKVRQMWLMFLLLVLLPMLLILLWQGWTWVVELYAVRLQTHWLEDFYRANAPEKLSDPQYVARTIAKYKGRMFLLWRNLEKTYKVKWPAPFGAVEL